MPAGLDQTYLFDFPCEHTPGKSRVVALIGTMDAPRCLTAVMTCKDQALAYRAQLLLRRILAARDGSWAGADLAELAAALPDAPAGSLRQAAVHAATGTWPLACTIHMPEPEEEDEEPVEAASGARTVTRDGARLKDLPGMVVRVAHLREFHITDEDVLLREALGRGWEPMPASELDEDDPRDLVGAVMTLAEEGGQIVGADTLEDQCEAGLLRPQNGDELAVWSERPIRTHFSYGLRLARHPVEADAASEPAAAQEPAADLAALFPLKDCQCGGEECEDCGWQLTPRTADLLLTALSVLSDQAYEESEELRDMPLTDLHRGNWGVFERLPELTFGADRRWRRRMARAFDDLADDLEAGHWPEPSCTAEEMALHLAIEDAPSYLDDIEDRDDHTRLREHGDDYDWHMCSSLFFQDHDVLMLFDSRTAGIAYPDDAANQRLGVGDLRRQAWFESFGNTPVRDPARGFRR
ncbi:hypothetical protein [Streptacidiphilus fuscans]|uniref:Uncharacterized protein n=1 Tax=Streptacidiphilus fuscans TaxID=2789292 RepID=A0A931B6X1_9ACTN|nr:hypothetical protein [Streptacidiphilus fuscans]MBF9071544.1 hypothetical protein [Streptacidiphilus fuscans]